MKSPDYFRSNPAHRHNQTGPIAYKPPPMQLAEVMIISLYQFYESGSHRLEKGRIQRVTTASRAKKNIQLLWRCIANRPVDKLLPCVAYVCSADNAVEKYPSHADSVSKRLNISIIKLFLPLGDSPFLCQTLWQYSDGDIPNGWGKKNPDFRPISPCISE